MTSDFTVNDHNDPYVEARDGNLYIRGTRVQFASIILYRQQGQTPEDLHRAFPSVPLAAVYGAIAFYLVHQAEMDAFLAEYRARWQTAIAADEAAKPEVYAKLRRILAEGQARQAAESASSAESPVA